MNKHIPCLIIFLALFTTAARAQSLADIVEGPVYAIACDSTCATVHLSHQQPRITTSYTISPASYAPENMTGSTVVALTDDHFSQPLDIGFRFCFYGNTYTQFILSDNGHITFNTLYAGQPASFDTETPLPFYNSSFPDAAIFSPFMDHKPAVGGVISYKLLGVKPFRRLAIQWSGMQLFGSSCNGTPSTYQVVLYETSNEIIFHITQKSVCNNDPSNYRNYATLGIQSLGAGSFLTVPGRNASIWAASNESWRYTPNGAPGWTINWHDETAGLLSTHNDSVRICANTFPHRLYAEIHFTCPDTTVWDTLTIIKNLPVIDSIAVDSPSCQNTTDGMVTIYAHGAAPLSYTSGGQPWQSSNVVGGLGTGPVTIRVKDGNGCIKDTILILHPLSNLDVQLSNIFTPTCPDSNGTVTAIATGGTGPYTYSWSNGDMDSVLNGVPGNVTYVVTVTDANGCQDIAFIELQYLGLPVLTKTVVKPICDSATGTITINASGGTPPYTYLWQPNVSTSPTASNLLPGTYFTYVTDVNGCTKGIATVLVDTLDVLAARDTLHSTCGLANGEGTVHPTGSIAPYTYAWSSGQTSQTATGLEGGQTYSVITTAANGCKRTDYFFIKPSLAVELSLFPANAHCDSINGVISTQVVNDSGTVNYAWSTGAASPYLSGLAPGTYSLIVTDGRGCSDTGSTTLGDDGTPFLSIVDYQPPKCYGDSTGTVTLGGISGVAPYKYSLDGVNFSTTATITGISGGVYTIYIRDANSCPNDTTLTFGQPSQIDAAIGPLDTLICYDDVLSAVQAQAVGGFPPYLFSWDGGAYSNNNAVSQIAIGSHELKIQDSNGCVVSKSYVVPGPPAPLAVDFITKDNPCFYTRSGAIQAIAAGGWSGYAYNWNTGSTGDLLDSLEEGRYVLTVTDARGCVVERADTVVQNLCCLARIANAFTPNGDQKNDVLHVLGISEISELDYRIYNRFGQEVFRSNDLAKGWDGSWNGVAQPMGVYFYLVRYKCPFAQDEQLLKGDVTLIR